MPTPITVLLIILAVLVSLLLFFFGFTYYTYSIAFKRKSRQIDLSADLGIEIKKNDTVREMIKELSEKEYEEVSIISHDGLTLKGRYYHKDDNAPIELMFHGYRSNPLRDFSGGALIALDNGHNVLLVHQRSHGESEGSTITFGAKESTDVISWSRYLTERFGDDSRIILSGISMGAATVLIASSLELPSQVKCIIADCPYSSARDILMLTAKRMGFPPKLVYPFIRLGGRIYGGFDPEDADPQKAVKCSRLPILLIHGEADSFVPKYMSDKIFECHGGEMYYHTFEGADHGLSYIVDTERYKRIKADFLSKYLTKKESEKQ